MKKGMTFERSSAFDIGRIYKGAGSARADDACAVLGITPGDIDWKELWDKGRDEVELPDGKIMTITFGTDRRTGSLRATADDGNGNTGSMLSMGDAPFAFGESVMGAIADLVAQMDPRDARSPYGDSPDSMEVPDDVEYVDDDGNPVDLGESISYPKNARGRESEYAMSLGSAYSSNDRASTRGWPKYYLNYITAAKSLDDLVSKEASVPEDEFVISPFTMVLPTEDEGGPLTAYLLRLKFDPDFLSGMGEGETQMMKARIARAARSRVGANGESISRFDASEYGYEDPDDTMYFSYGEGGPDMRRARKEDRPYQYGFPKVSAKGFDEYGDPAARDDDDVDAEENG